MVIQMRRMPHLTKVILVNMLYSLILLSLPCHYHYMLDNAFQGGTGGMAQSGARRNSF